MARGMSPEEARYAAHRKLGNLTLIREEIYRMNSLNWLETLWQDLRFALRMLAQESRLHDCCESSRSPSASESIQRFSAYFTIRFSRVSPLAIPKSWCSLCGGSARRAGQI